MSNIGAVNRNLVTFHPLWAEADLTLEELGLVFWIMLKGGAATSFIEQEFPELDKESILRVEEYGTIDPLKPPRKKRTKPRKAANSQYNQDRRQLEDHFIAITGLPSPKTGTGQLKKRAAVQWWNPLKNILELTDRDVEKAIRLINDTIEQMRDDGLTIYSPQSIEKVATSLHASKSMSLFSIS